VLFNCEICIRPRHDILDPQGDAVGAALGKLGFSAQGVRVGRYILLELEADDQAAAQQQASEMCEKLLANPITEDFEVRVKQA
jgi:phosphoribosylformylglycinamidine synthase